MSEFQANIFFNLDEVPAIAPLFEDVQNVWNAVVLLPSFIEKILEPKVLGEVEEGAWLEPGKVYLGEGARVERGAVIRGPTIIGPHSVVRSGAYIRGHVFTGSHCLIGAGTEVRNSMLLNYSNIPHQNLVFSSLIGNRVNVAGQSTVANKRLDDREIMIRIKREDSKESYPTGTNRFGVIIGDHTEIGAMCMLQPGTVIGKHCFIYPHLCVGGYIAANTTVKQ